jgi:hypothetical protein
MSKEYHVSLNGKSLGTFSLDELKEKKINPESMIWFEGLPDWLPVDQVEELKDFVKSTPPPIPRAQSKKIIYGKGYFVFGLTCIILGGTLNHFGIIDKMIAEYLLVVIVFSLVFRFLVTVDITRAAKDYKRSYAAWGLFAFLIPSTACFFLFFC